MQVQRIEWKPYCANFVLGFRLLNPIGVHTLAFLFISLYFISHFGLTVQDICMTICAFISAPYLKISNMIPIWNFLLGIYFIWKFHSYTCGIAHNAEMIAYTITQMYSKCETKMTNKVWRNKQKYHNNEKIQ